mgnify:CR=1 FL=1
MSLTQILAISIFVLMFLLVVSERLPRHYVTLGSGALMMIIVFGFCMRSSEAFLTTLNFHAFIEPNFWIAIGEHEEATAGINWATIVFIFGMMVMVIRIVIMLMKRELILNLRVVLIVVELLSV